MFDAYAARAKQRRAPVGLALLVAGAAIAAVVYAMRTTEAPAPALAPEPFGPIGSAEVNAPPPELHRVQLPGMSIEMLFDPQITGTDAKGTAAWILSSESTYVVKWFEEAEPAPDELDGKMRAWLTAAMQDGGVPLRILGARPIRVGDQLRHALVYDSGDPLQPGRGVFSTVPCGTRLVYLLATNIDDRGVELAWGSFRCELSGG